jgi:hypothetical protein
MTWQIKNSSTGRHVQVGTQYFMGQSLSSPVTTLFGPVTNRTIRHGEVWSATEKRKIILGKITYNTFAMRNLQAVAEDKG